MFPEAVNNVLVTIFTINVFVDRYMEQIVFSAIVLSVCTVACLSLTRKL